MFKWTKSSLPEKPAQSNRARQLREVIIATKSFGWRTKTTFEMPCKRQKNASPLRSTSSRAVSQLSNHVLCWGKVTWLSWCAWRNLFNWARFCTYWSFYSHPEFPSSIFLKKNWCDIPKITEDYVEGNITNAKFTREAIYRTRLLWKYVGLYNSRTVLNY